MCVSDFRVPRNISAALPVEAESAWPRQAGARVHTRGALAFRHLNPVRPAGPLIRPANDGRGVRPPVPLMSLVVPIPLQYRSTHSPQTPIVPVVSSSGSMDAVPPVRSRENSSVPQEPVRCACGLFNDIRHLVISAMRWSQNDTLAIMVTKASRSFPNLHPILRSNIVAAALSVREEERMGELLRRRTIEQNHLTFIDDFDEWLRLNQREEVDAPVQDEVLDSLRELADALEN